jgi:uncharacterized damage-inducible protein DinB
MTAFEQEFVDQCIFRLEENPPRIEKCFKLLSEDEIWIRPNESSNSIGNLILHLSGNIRQYAISSLGNKPDLRVRDTEFEVKNGLTKAQLWEILGQTILEAKGIIYSLNTEEWRRKRMVQGFNFTGIGILIHVIEHLSYHTGQIAYFTKELKNKPLGFYDDFDLKTKNKSV